MASSGDMVTRKYSNFRGVDFRGDEANLMRSPECLNMWKDYKELESIRTRPGMDLQQEFGNTVWGVFFYTVGTREMMLVHAGTKLYQIENDARTLLYEGLNMARSRSFVYSNIWYFMDGISYLRYDGQQIGDVIGYVPTTSYSRSPAGGGKTLEDVNMLTGMRINSFCADGEGTEYYLDTTNIDADFQPLVMVNDVQMDTSAYSVDTSGGRIIFNEAPKAPLTDGQDNVTVKFRKTVAGYRERIEQCTLLQVFDNRVFFSGNPNYPNTVWHCSLNDPSYCSDYDYYNEGLDSAKVTGLVAGEDALWVFKEPSQANTAVFYHKPSTDASYGKIYPSTHSSVSTGCVGAAVNFNDDIVFFSEQGMEAINGGITSEQVLAHRSSLVDRKLLTEELYRRMILAEWMGYLLVFVGRNVYLADRKGMFTNGDHLEYEWFYWELDKQITCVREHEGQLYLGTEDGIYTLTNYEVPIHSYWTTPIDRMEAQQYQKTTNKRGCVVEGIGNVEVHVKTNNTEWEKVGAYQNVTDYFVCRIKKKKFKDIQLKFSSDSRFSLESVTMECYIGGYIKR